MAAHAATSHRSTSCDPWHGRAQHFLSFPTPHKPLVPPAHMHAPPPPLLPTIRRQRPHRVGVEGAGGLGEELGRLQTASPLQQAAHLVGVVCSRHDTWLEMCWKGLRGANGVASQANMLRWLAGRRRAKVRPQAPAREARIAGTARRVLTDPVEWHGAGVGNQRTARGKQSCGDGHPELMWRPAPRRLPQDGGLGASSRSGVHCCDHGGIT